MMDGLPPPKPGLWMPEKPAIVRPAEQRLIRPMSLMPVFSPVVGAAAPVSVEFVEHTASSSGNTTNHVISVSFNSDEAGREIFVVILANNNSALSIDSVNSVGDDNSPSLLVQEPAASNDDGVVGIARAAPSGTSGDVDVTISTSTKPVSVAIYKVLEAGTTETVRDSGSPLDLSINLEADGAYIGGATDRNGSSMDGDWGGSLTQDYNVDISTEEWRSGAHGEFASAQEPLSVTGIDAACGAAVAIAPN